MSDLVARFPDILPREEIRISEDHEYRVVEYSDGSTSTKRIYEPDKAPFISIDAVYADVDGESTELEQGIDYGIVDKDHDGRPDAIDFSIGGDDPDDGTTFTIEYIAESILLRYVDSYEDELHRVRTDVDTVINSRYVDFAEQTGIIDNFEDQQIVEYELQSGSEGDYLVQSDVAYEGDWALDLHAPAGEEVLLLSDAGLPRYPQAGDTISYHTWFDSNDSVYFDLLYSESSDGERQYYRVEIDNSDNTFSLIKDGGSKVDSISVDTTALQREWIRVEVTVDTIGNVSATIFDADGSSIGSVSFEDAEYTEGDLRLGSFNASEETDVYFDNIRVTKRNSNDLDRIGALFGQLGRRRGRDDSEYTTFLRSIVESFSGRGTKSGIKFAVASALDIPESAVVIEEDFVDNEYSIVIEEPWPPHAIQTLVELSDLADPSGVFFKEIRYELESDAVGCGDSVDTDIDVTEATDNVTTTDAVTIGPNSFSIDEDATVDDAVTAEQTATGDHTWDDYKWDQMEWA